MATLSQDQQFLGTYKLYSRTACELGCLWHQCQRGVWPSAQGIVRLIIIPASSRCASQNISDATNEAIRLLDQRRLVTSVKNRESHIT